MPVPTTAAPPAIIPPKGPPAAFLDDQEWADDGSGSIEIQFPLISLTQATSTFEQAKKHVGEFYHHDTGTFESPLNVIPLWMQHQQALFEKDKTAPSCSSADGVKPRPGSPLWQQDTMTTRDGPTVQVPLRAPSECQLCPFYAFGAGGQRPACNSSIMLLVQREDESFAQLRIGGSGLKPFRQVVARQLQSKNRRLPLYTHMFTFDSTDVAAAGQSYMQLTVAAQPLPIEKQREMNAMAAAMRGDFARAAAAEPVSEDAAKPQWQTDAQFGGDADDVPLQ